MRSWLALVLIVTISVVATAQGAAALMATEIDPEHTHPSFVYDAAIENVSTERQPVEISPVGRALSAPSKASMVRPRLGVDPVAPNSVPVMGSSDLDRTLVVPSQVTQRGTFRSRCGIRSMR